MSGSGASGAVVVETAGPGLGSGTTGGPWFGGSWCGSIYVGPVEAGGAYVTFDGVPSVWSENGGVTIYSTTLHGPAIVSVANAADDIWIDDVGLIHKIEGRWEFHYWNGGPAFVWGDNGGEGGTWYVCDRGDSIFMDVQPGDCIVVFSSSSFSYSDVYGMTPWVDWNMDWIGGGMAVMRFYASGTVQLWSESCYGNGLAVQRIPGWDVYMTNCT